MILLRWFITTLAIFALPYFVGGIKVAGILTAVLAAAVLVFINTIIRPIVTILTLPLNILTLGLFSFILNGIFFWFVAHLISGFSVATFSAAVIGAFIISVVNWIVGHFVKHE